MTDKAASTTVARTADVPALIAGLITVTAWGSAFVAIRAAGHTLPPGALALGRLVVSTAILSAGPPGAAATTARSAADRRLRHRLARRLQHRAQCGRTPGRRRHSGDDHQHRALADRPARRAAPARGVPARAVLGQCHRIDRLRRDRSGDDTTRDALCTGHCPLPGRGTGLRGSGSPAETGTDPGATVPGDLARMRGRHHRLPAVRADARHRRRQSRPGHAWMDHLPRRCSHRTGLRNLGVRAAPRRRRAHGHAQLPDPGGGHHARLGSTSRTTTMARHRRRGTLPRGRLSRPPANRQRTAHGVTAALKAPGSASSPAESMGSISRDPGRQQYTTCPAVAPDAAFTICRTRPPARTTTQD